MSNSWIKFSDNCLKQYINRNLDYTKKGEIKDTKANLITVLINPKFCKRKGIVAGEIFFDTCSMTIKFLGYVKGEEDYNKNSLRNWTDQLTNIVGIEIEMEYGIKYSKNKMEDAISFIANKRSVNLPKMYLKSLEYDGNEYISMLLPKYLGAEDTPLNSWIIRHVLIGMVKRVFNPGCKFDELLVLTGEQGVGKTSFIEKLALLPEWYCSLSSIKGKDAVSNLLGKIVVELEEFVALRNAKSADEAKQFISSRTSTVRLPYARFSEDIKRTCILIATTNDITFLGDFTGERRYLPVQVNQKNIKIPVMYDTEKFPQLKTITKKQHEEIVRKDFHGAIAQAVYLYEQNCFESVLPKELKSDLELVIQIHKKDNRSVQNFHEFMDWKINFSDTPDVLCSAEYTSKYPDTNEKIFSELMAIEMSDEWEVEVSSKSKKYKIDGVYRVSKKFYKRRLEKS